MELAAPPISDGPGVLYEDPDCFAALDIKIDTYNGLLSHSVFVAIDAKRVIIWDGDGRQREPGLGEQFWVNCDPSGPLVLT